MYGMYPPWNFGYLPTPTGVDPIKTLKEYTRFLEKQEEKTKNKKKDDKPKARMFTGLEVLGLLTLMGPVVGLAYISFLSYCVQYMNEVLHNITNVH